jgi:colanic acid/amylovoran biosynthesis glycosyltransferase
MENPVSARGPVSLFQSPHQSNPAEPACRPVAGCYLATFLKPEMMHVYRQITALRRYQPIVFTQKRENPAQFPFEPVQVQPKPRTHALRRLWQKQILGRPITMYRSEADLLLSNLRTNNASILHVYFGHMGVHLLPLLEQRSLPTVVSFHGADAQVDMDRPTHRASMQRALSLATLLLVRSESLGKHLIELGADPGKIRLHRTGIPLEQIPMEPHAPPADGKWVCLQACRLIQKKGIPTTLRAFAHFCKTFPDSRLILAGDGPEEAALRALAHSLGLDGRVEFTGFLSQEALGRLRSEAHLFLHPSERSPTGDEEGVPNSLLEAMASGLPVLASRHGGIPEAVDPGTSGLLVDERDWRALGEAMLEVANSPETYRSLSRAGRQHVLERFALSTQVAVLESAYDEARARFAGG